MNSESYSSLWLILILVCVVLVLIYVRRKFKTLNLPCVFFVSGAVKSGKTLLSVHLAIKEYKKALRWFYIRRFLLSLFRWKKCEDDNYPPMLYSNIPLAKVKYNPLTLDIIENKVRIPNKSVVLIDEVSLFADSQLWNDRDLNNLLMRFYKLYGHYSHGGKLIIDSQSIADNHFSLKRCMSNYLYIQDRKKFPIFSILYVREMIYSEDGSAINVVDKDLELDLRKVLILNTTYNKYDCYCYSIFTDELPYKVCYDVDAKGKHDSLKCDYIITLNDFVHKMNEEYKAAHPNIQVDEEGVVINEDSQA